MTSEDLLPNVTERFDVIVHPALIPLAGVLNAQPSKNYTTRYLLAAALAAGESVVENCATSADSIALQRCLLQMGAKLISEADTTNDSPIHEFSRTFNVHGVGGRPRLSDSLPVNTGNAGAVLRFLLAVGALLPEVTFVTDHPKSLGTRPNKDLLDVLEQLGCKIESESGLLPITLMGGNLHGGEVTISGARSSQFLSGLLFLAPLIGEEVRICVSDTLVSKAPIRQTLEVLTRSGIEVSTSDDLMSFVVKPGSYTPGTYRVNGDWPGSSALLAAVAVTGGEMLIDDLYNDEQGEKAAADVLRRIGADVEFEKGETSVRLRSNAILRGFEFDGDLATDAVLALMGAACFAEGRSRFYNVSNLRIKECDRISDPIAELRKLGVKCWEGNEIGDSDPDAIIIEGNPNGYEGGVTVDGRDDHRVIMLLSIVALRCHKPVRIIRAHQVSKSYPKFFEHLSALGAKITFAEASA